MPCPEKETRPVSDPYAEDAGPINPNIIGRLRMPPEDTGSIVDHLASLRNYDDPIPSSATVYRQQPRR